MITDFHVYIHQGSDLTDQLKAVSQSQATIIDLLQQIRGKEETIMANLDALTAQVKANTDVEGSAIVLLNGLSDQLKQIANDPQAVAALASQLKTSGDSLAAAIVANTPAA